MTPTRLVLAAALLAAGAHAGPLSTAADNNQHAANENMRMGDCIEGIRTIHGLMTQPPP